MGFPFLLLTQCELSTKPWAVITPVVNCSFVLKNPTSTEAGDVGARHCSPATKSTVVVETTHTISFSLGPSSPDSVLRPRRSPQLLDEKELLVQLRQVREVGSGCSTVIPGVSWPPSIPCFSTLVLWLRTGWAGWSSLLTLLFPTLSPASQVLESRLQRPLPEDLAEALANGVILCQLANQLRPRSVPFIHVPSPAVVSWGPGWEGGNGTRDSYGLASPLLTSLFPSPAKTQYPQVSEECGKFLRSLSKNGSA